MLSLLIDERQVIVGDITVEKTSRLREPSW